MEKPLDGAGRTFVTSDLHFNHKNIIAYERGGFSSIEEHNETIVSLYNETVGEDDVCWILGDVGFGKAALQTLIPRMHGHKILVMGNHDDFSEARALEMGFEKVFKGPTYYPESNGRIILSHYPAMEAFNNPYVINVHGHLHGCALDAPNFFNANVALNGYRPIDMRRFMDMIGGLASRRLEWYAGESAIAEMPIKKEDGSWKGSYRK
jgi:calcineurin-like phosphoesterase family protein